MFTNNNFYNSNSNLSTIMIVLPILKPIVKFESIEKQGEDSDFKQKKKNSDKFTLDYNIIEQLNDIIGQNKNQETTKLLIEESSIEEGLNEELKLINNIKKTNELLLLYKEQIIELINYLPFYKMIQNNIYEHQIKIVNLFENKQV